MKSATDRQAVPISDDIQSVVIHRSFLKGKNKVLLLLLFVLYMVCTPSMNQFAECLSSGAGQAFANGKTKTLSDGQVVPINEVLYPYNARMPSSGGVSLETFENAWKRLSVATGFDAFVWYADEDETNAYITRDREGDFVVVVYRGLLDILRTEDEIAGVLAHEIGHGINGHLSKTRDHNTGVVVAANVLSHVLGAGKLGDLAIGVGANLAVQGYSREQEVEADDFGVEYAWRAGYSPWSLYDSILRMADAGQVTTPSGFNSHPPTERRMSRLRAQAERWENEGAAKEAPSDESKKSLPDQGASDKQTEKDTGNTPAPLKKNIPGFDPNSSEDVKVISTYPIDGGQQNSLAILQRGGISKYSAGKYKEAFAAFTRAAESYEGNYLSAFWAAKAGQKMGKKNEMAFWIDRALSINPEYKPALQFRGKYLK